MRKEFNIPKTTHKRAYEAVPNLPLGFQAQVDFGQTWQKNDQGQSVKLYVVAFVLSNSRYKYKEWLDRPFTTKDLIEAHKNAFHAFGGKPKEIVYDQDNIIIVSENSGDIIYTKQFEAYRREETFQVYACRGYDPESKGKIENVIGFIKNSFAKHRVYTTLDDWNEQGKQWLKRRGNGKVHNTTKKKPIDVFQVEKHYLRPVKQLISIPANSSLALKYLDEVNNQYPRYIRDQLQLINKTWDKFPNQYINEGLVMCMDQKLYSASEFQDMIKFLIAQRPIKSVEKPKNIRSLHDETSYLLDIKPPVRDIAPYMAIMEGGDPS